MEELVNEKNDGTQHSSGLPEVNIDLLVEAGFNNARSAYHQNLETAKLEVGGEMEGSISQQDYYLGGLGELSPRDISAEQDSQMGKDTQLPLVLYSGKNNNFPSDSHVGSFNHSLDLQAFPNAPAELRCGGPSISREILSQPETFESQEPMMLESSVLPQRDWQIGSQGGAMEAGMGFEGVPAISNLNMRSALPMTIMDDPISVKGMAHPSRGETAISHSVEDPLPLQPVKEMRKPPRRRSERTRSSSEATTAATSTQTVFTPKAGRKGVGRRKSSTTAHLSLEEKKKLRAARNRESAEKSRMRRKQMIHDLETNVARLREENQDLKEKVERYHNHLTMTGAKVRRGSETLDSDEVMTDQSNVPILYEALSALQRCMEECPRTFRKGTYSPPIPLNLPRAVSKNV